MPLDVSLVFLPEFDSTAETSAVSWRQCRALEYEEGNLVMGRFEERSRINKLST